MRKNEGYQVFDPGELLSDNDKSSRNTRVSLYYRFRNKLADAKAKGIPFDFNLTEEDCERFYLLIGPIPEDMVKPTIGRKDHSKGYIVEGGIPNFEWQEQSDNSREGMLRTMTKENRARGSRMAALTGAPGRASGKSSKSVNNILLTCPGCGRTSRGGRWKQHVNNLVCQKV
jgi:hypothetical protein